MNSGGVARDNLTRFAWLSIATAIATIGLKTGAYLVTGSVGLLSDAAESLVNLVAAIVALIALRVAAAPHDAEHHFGHTKAEYFAAALEGLLIFLAAAYILWTAFQRLLEPRPLENVGVGLLISVAAAALNGIVAWVLIRAGRQHRSITLEADGKHLLTDVWTSVGVVVAVLLVGVSGWLILDPIVAILVGLNIIWTGYGLINRSLNALLDHSMPREDNERLLGILEQMQSDQVRIHTIRTRVAGHQEYISMHVLVPGVWSVQRGHDLLEDIEGRIRDAFPNSEVFTHLEPIEDPRAYEGEYPGLRLSNHHDSTRPPAS